EMATAIAGQIALAAENARLVRQAEAHADELGALHDVTATLTSTLDLPTVLEAVADSARALIGAQRCGVFELDASQQLVPRVSRGVPVDALLTLRPSAAPTSSARCSALRAPSWPASIRGRPSSRSCSTRPASPARRTSRCWWSIPRRARCGWAR